MSQRHLRSPSKPTRRQAIKAAAACFTFGGASLWNHGSAAPPEPIPAVVVLDDSDPNFRGEIQSHDDGLRLLTANGKVVWRIGGLSNCQTVAMNHGIALDPGRGRIYARELVGRRVTATDPAGRIVWRVERIRASAVAVDPDNGDLWCLVDDGTIENGELVVLDTKGTHHAKYPIRGVDIAYDSYDQAFWVIGKDLVRVDRRGKELLMIRNFAAWTCASVAPIPGAGEAWLVERKHPQVAGSRSRLLRVSTTGELRQSIERDDWIPFGVACEPKTGQAWVVDLRKALVRVPIGEDPCEPLPIPALAVAIGRKSGQVWVATQDQIIRLKYGVPVVKTSLGKPSGQVWLSAF